MKLLVKLLFAILIIGFLLPFTLIKGKDGKPLLSFSDLKAPKVSMPDWPKIPASNSSPIEASGAVKNGGGKDIIYRWTDAEGNTQFSNQPPPQGVEYSVKGYDPDQNVIQAVKIEPKEAEQGEELKSGEGIKKASDIGNPYSPEKVEKLFDDANNIENLLSDRLKKQQAAIGD